MKISKAKQKVCPFIQNGAITAGTAIFGEVNQFTYANINCVCGECMAWVYTEEFELVDELCISFTNGELDKSSYQISQQITPSHHRISGGNSSCVNGGSRYETWAKKIEIAENEKSGYCVRLGVNNG